MSKNLRFIASLFTLFLFSNSLLNGQQCPGTTDFSANGSYTVPAGATQITITLKGGDGGNTTAANGGAGATINATFPVRAEGTVKPGSVINFYIGGAGESSPDQSGAGGGGATVAVIDGSPVPLAIAAGGGGASNGSGSGGKKERHSVTTSTEQGGTQNLNGGGGSGAGATTLEGTTDPGDPGDNVDPGQPVGNGGDAHPSIMTSFGGDGGRGSLSNVAIGKDGGDGGGGAGGNANGNFLYAHAGGGGGGGYNGGNGGIGSNGAGEGGTSYIYLDPSSSGVTAGANGGGTESAGSASICYISAVIQCGSVQTLNSSFDEYSPIEGIDPDGDNSTGDRYTSGTITGDAACFEHWERSNVRNAGGSSAGIACDEAVFEADATGTLSQTIPDICEGQAVVFCFELAPTFGTGNTTDFAVTLGGEEIIRLDNNDVTPGTVSLGSGASSFVINNQNAVSAGAGPDKIATGDIVQVCVTVDNYSGTVPAKLEFINTISGSNSVRIDDPELTLSEITAPSLEAADCGDASMFDLTTIEPMPVPTGLTLQWKDDMDNVVADPSSVGSGTYKACYSKNCGGNCASEACKEVTISCQPQPIDLFLFEAESSGRDAVLNWTTLSEINNDRFEIERSFDGESFEVIGKVKGNGNTSKRHNYDYVDKNVGDKFDIVYYRLNQVDFDNKASNSDVVLVSFDDKKNAFIYPNPAQMNFSVRTVDYQGVINVMFSDMHGKVVYTLSTSDRFIDLMNIKSGVYQVSIFSDLGEILLQESIIVTK